MPAAADHPGAKGGSTRGHANTVPQPGKMPAEAAEGLRQGVGLRAWPGQRQGEAQVLAQIRQSVGAAQFDQNFAVGTRSAGNGRN